MKGKHLSPSIFPHQDQPLARATAKPVAVWTQRKRPQSAPVARRGWDCGCTRTYGHARGAGSVSKRTKGPRAFQGQFGASGHNQTFFGVGIQQPTWRIQTENRGFRLAMTPRCSNVRQSGGFLRISVHFGGTRGLVGGVQATLTPPNSIMIESLWMGVWANGQNQSNRRGRQWQETAFQFEP